MTASNYDGRLSEPPYNTETGPVVALQQELDEAREQVCILREALEAATSDIEDLLSELKLINSQRQNHNEEARMKRFRAVLEATKEGA